MRTFKPQGVYFTCKIPDSYWETKEALIIDAATKDQMTKDYINSGEDMEVVATGSDCNFVKPGDLVAVNSRGFVSLDLDGKAYFVIRESEVLGKYE